MQLFSILIVVYLVNLKIPIGSTTSPEMAREVYFMFGDAKQSVNDAFCYQSYYFLLDRGLIS